jgi:hypothetical protein
MLLDLAVSILMGHKLLPPHRLMMRLMSPIGSALDSVTDSTRLGVLMSTR